MNSAIASSGCPAVLPRFLVVFIVNQSAREPAAADDDPGRQLCMRQCKSPAAAAGAEMSPDMLNAPEWVMASPALPCLTHHCCCCCCCRYVVVEGDGTVAASWQRGANNVLALQLNDEEVEVYDNWWVPAADVLTWSFQSFLACEACVSSICGSSIRCRSGSGGLMRRWR